MCVCVCVCAWRAVIYGKLGMVEVMDQAPAQWFVVTVVPSNRRDAGVGQDEDDVEDVHLAGEQQGQE